MVLLSYHISLTVLFIYYHTRKEKLKMNILRNIGRKLNKIIKFNKKRQYAQIILKCDEPNVNDRIYTSDSIDVKPLKQCVIDAVGRDEFIKNCKKHKSEW